MSITTDKSQIERSKINDIKGKLWHIEIGNVVRVSGPHVTYTADASSISRQLRCRRTFSLSFWISFSLSHAHSTLLYSFWSSRLFPVEFSSRKSCHKWRHNEIKINPYHHQDKMSVCVCVWSQGFRNRRVSQSFDDMWLIHLVFHPTHCARTAPHTHIHTSAALSIFYCITLFKTRIPIFHSHSQSVRVNLFVIIYQNRWNGFYQDATAVNQCSHFGFRQKHHKFSFDSFATDLFVRDNVRAQKHIASDERAPNDCVRTITMLRAALLSMVV